MNDRHALRGVWLLSDFVALAFGVGLVLVLDFLEVLVFGVDSNLRGGLGKGIVWAHCRFCLSFRRESCLSTASIAFFLLTRFFLALMEK